MKRGLISWVLILALMASTFVGAMGAFVSTAYADEPSSYGVGYFGDLASDARESCPAIRLVYFDALCAYATENFDSSLIVVMHDLNTVNWYFAVYTFDSNTVADRWAFTDRNYNVFKARSSNNSFYFYCQYCVGWTSNNSFSVTNPPKYIDSANGSSVTYGTQGYYVPSPTNTNVSGRLCYANQIILAWSGSGSIFNEYWTPNLLNGNAPPQYILFDVVVFYVGERKYFTFLQQDIFRDMMPDHMDYMVSFYADSSDEVISFTWDDVILLPGAQNYINQPFSNVSPAGIYAVDISIYDWVVLDLINLVGFDEDFHAYFAGYAVNSPYRIVGEPGTNGQPDSYTQSMNYFYEYTQNYNTTHFIPENLAETLFGLNGSKMYPCEVSVPVSISNEFDLTEATSFADVHTWQWWFSSREDLGMNFELMDVCIIPMSTTGNYSVVYYYSDSLSLQFEFVSNFSFDEICDNFDVVIIIPDDKHVLSSANYWKLAYQTILAIFNRDPSYFDGSWLTYQGITGSSSLGVEYLDSRPNHGDYAGILEGFCIVTRKALQRQQLFVFNEGITKTYELMSNYLEERGKWEDSFLSWTMSLFYQWQTLDGKLGDIYNLLFELHIADWMADISSKLQTLVENTSPSEASPWYLPLWNFIQRFTPTVEQFADTIDVIDNAYDDLPLLPEVTVPPAVPTVPLIGGG